MNSNTFALALGVGLIPFAFFASAIIELVLK